MKTDNRRRVLLISYHFPPSAAVGGQRMANFASHLCRLGWDPHVLTIQDKNVEHMDPERLQSVKDVVIHKAAVHRTALEIGLSLINRFRRLVSANARSPEGSQRALGGSRASGREGLSQRVRRFFVALLVLPDLERGWVLPASVKAIRTIRRHRIDWIVTSCPPYSVHLIGLVVKRLTGTRWVADFRDPWMTTGSKRLYSTSALSIRIESWLERKVMTGSDVAVFNVERLRNAYRERYAELPREKFVFIPNSITQDLSKPVGLDKYKTFTLSYTGSLYVGRTPEPVFRALSRLIQDGKAAPDSVRLKLIGHCDQIDGVPTSSVIRQYGLESVVEVIAPVPYAKAMEIVARSHLALLLAPGLPFQIPAKVYDYLGVGTRILAIADQGGTSDLIRETNAGETFSSEDIEGITRFVCEEMTTPHLNNGISTNALARFDVRRTTEELAGLMRRFAVAGEVR